MHEFKNKTDKKRKYIKNNKIKKTTKSYKYNLRN